MKRTALLSLLLLALLCGCDDSSKKLKVKTDNTSDSFGLYQNLEIVFDKDVVLVEQTGEWDTLTYLTFEPPVFGRFMWTAPNILSFSPAMGFAPATTYVASFSTQAFATLDEKLTVPDKPLRFSTVSLDLQTVNCFWDIREGKKGIQFLLSFNFNVLPENIDELVSVKLDKETFKPVVDRELQNSQISLFVEYLPEKSPENATVIIAKGATCPDCGTPTSKEIIGEVGVPALDDFAVTSFEATSEYDINTIMLYFSQPVEENGLQKQLKVEPAITNMKVEAVSGGIAITGDFNIENNYTVTVSKELKSRFGFLLKEDYTAYTTFSEPTPYLEFEDQSATYLSLKGQRNLVLKAANVKEINLSVFKVYENNIEHYLNDGKDWGWDYEDDEWYDYNYWPMSSRYGDVIFYKRIQMAQLPVQAGRYLLNLNPDELQLDSKYKGIYVIKVEDYEHAWLQSTLLVSMSDIGLVARKGDNSFMVCAMSIQNGTPLSGVNITLISDNNQDVITQTTNQDGIVLIEDTKTKFHGFDISRISARKDNDFNYLRLYQSEVNSSRYDLSGKWTNVDFDVFIYGDRALYRPGDSVHINAIVRDWDFGTVSDIPANIRVRNPLGEQFGLYRKTLSKDGSTSLSFALPDYAATGGWNITFENAAGVVQKNYHIQVEEFMPDRIKVTTTIDKSVYTLGDAITLSGEAFNLYGPPAVGRNYEVSLDIRKKSFYAPKYSDYNFWLRDNDYRYYNENREGKTSQNGQFSEHFSPDLYDETGVYRGTVYSTVFDENGRPVNRLNTFDYFTQNIFLGIREHDYWYGTSRPLQFNLIAVDTKGELAQANGVRAKIIRYYYETIQTRVSGSNRFEYRSQRRTEVVFDKDININGKDAVLSYTPKVSGSYELQLYLPGNTQTYTSTSFYAYGHESTSSSSFAVDKEGSIKIELDKKEYEPNEKAQILFTAPFSGRLLVTIEGEKVKDYFWLTLNDKSASMTLPLKNTYMPNCYISAMAFRDLSESNAVPLTIARGYENITVRKKSNNIAVTIKAEEKSRSNTTQKIKIETIPNSHVTVAVVDEGILQITNYKTPDPYNYFYGKRALGLRAYDLYPWLFRETSFGNSTSGGDEALDLERMVNPMTNKRVKLVTFWSGTLQADKSGKAEFVIDVPQFSGSLRVMAVAWKDGQFGSTSQNMTVADPLVISSGIPRFFSPGDHPKIPVVLTNTTDKEANAKVSLTTSSLLSIQGDKEATVKIPAKGEATCHFNIVATNDIGAAEIEVKVKAFNETFTEHTDISVRPAAGFTSNYNGGVIRDGEPFSMNTGADFVPSTVLTNLMLSRNLAMQYAGDLAKVMYYPYGCLEQTTSRAFPLLYLDDLATSIEKAKTGGQTTRFVINESIKRISSMKNSSGGLNYWPGSSSHSWWSECYAAHFLTEAQKAGYSVDEDMMHRLMIHLASHAKSQAKDEYYYWDSSIKDYRKYLKTSKSVIYALYVLALNGKQEIAQMNYYKSNVTDLSLDMRAMLAGAYVFTGDMPSANQLLNFTDVLPNTRASSGGDFSSYIRNTALMLQCLVDVAPDDARIPSLAMQLNKEVKNAGYLSTQERAFTLMAFGKLARKAAGSTITANVSFNGSNIGRFEGKDFSWKSAKGQAGKLDINAQGSGDLYYFVETSGIPTKGVAEKDNNLKARKRFLDRNGKEVNLSDVQQGALIYVEVAIQTTNTLRVENVAIQDLLPACFEIENPRLTSGSGQYQSWMKSTSSYDYLDIRDDRITFFTTVTPNVKYYYYIIRAVSTGTYQMGPLSATAMYDGNYTSTYGQGKVTVK